MIGKKFSAIILSGGRGARMNSALLKILHPVAGLPMLQRVIDILKAADIEDLKLVIPAGSKELLEQAIDLKDVECCTQEKPLGTGDALKAVKIESLQEYVLVINGDQLLIDKNYMKTFMDKFIKEKTALSVVTSFLKEPAHYGRICREEGKVHSIVESSEAMSQPAIFSIKEINVGIYLMKKSTIQKYLSQITNQNSKGEYYLTDIVSLCRQGQESIGTLSAPQHMAFGINTQEELARATHFLFQRKVKELMSLGVIVINPNNTYIEENVKIFNSSVIYPGCWIRGNTEIGYFCIIEPHSFIIDCKISDNVQIKAGSYLEESKIQKGCIIGPYAHLRPENDIGYGARIGNFVEMKKVEFGDYSKAAHLSYLGDAFVGEHVNIGCGVTTCNYAIDKKKYETKIGDHAFIGSDSQLVAPVDIGSHSVIGSGSVITRDIPPGALSISRSPQVNKENYAGSELDHLPSSDEDSDLDEEKI